MTLGDVYYLAWETKFSYEIELVENISTQVYNEYTSGPEDTIDYTWFIDSDSDTPYDFLKIADSLDEKNDLTHWTCLLKKHKCKIINYYKK